MRQVRIAKLGAPVRELVNLLFQVYVKPNGKQYTNREVARETGLNSGSLTNLRFKESKNITLGTMQALVEFFNIPLDYFVCETLEDAALFLVRLQAGESVKKHVDPRVDVDELIARIMAKTLSLSVEARRDLLLMMEWVECGDKYRLNSRQPIQDIFAED